LRQNLLAALEHLDRLRQRGGPAIVLALEPEPGCVLETTPQVLACFERMRLPSELSELAGVCLDCCHQAVEFEEPGEILRALEGAGIPIGKVQVSSALRAVGDQIAHVAQFDEPAYLHQVVARTRDGALLRYDDLPDFSAAQREGVEECRIHFHVPVFAAQLGGPGETGETAEFGGVGACGTTQFFLEEALARLGSTQVLEVETYSWDVLPAELRRGSLAQSIAREIEWTRERIGEAHRRP
jgi:hypothetical protein